MYRWCFGLRRCRMSWPHSPRSAFCDTGVVNLGPASSTFLATVGESAKAYRLDVERLDANGIMARWPEISVPEDYIGLFEANSGVLHSETAIKTWIDLAAKAGCAQLFNCPVTKEHHPPCRGFNRHHL